LPFALNPYIITAVDEFKIEDPDHWLPIKAWPEMWLFYNIQDNVLFLL
jgi:hypothetical protein